MRVSILAALFAVLCIGCDAPNYETPVSSTLNVAFVGNPEVVVTPAGDSLRVIPVSLSEDVVLTSPQGTNSAYSSIYLYPVDAVSKVGSMSQMNVRYVVESMLTPLPVLRVILVEPVEKK